MNITRKDATITNTDDAFPGEFEVVLSAQTLDRDEETLLQKDWKTPLPEWITFDSDHGMSVATTVGSGEPTFNDAGDITVRGTYSSLQRAQDVRTLVNEKHIRTVSVAFMSAPSTAKGAPKGAKVRELLNGAFVAVPSNREALILSSKGMKTGARNSASDAEHIQAMHDHTAALGASCPTPAKSVRTVTLKSVDGSLEATQDRARDALSDAYPGVYTYLRATVPSGTGGGTLVFGVEDDTSSMESFKQDYTDDGSVITLIGERSAVDLVEVIKPDPDESTEPPAAADVAAAEVAAAKSAAADESDALDVQCRSLQAQASAYVTE
jgi:hypothetical protein